MNINEYVLQAFNPLFRKSAFTKTSSDSVVLTMGEKHLVDIELEKIQLVNKIDLLSKIESSTEKTEIIDSAKVQNFLQAIDDKFVRLNHVGIGYRCDNAKEEIEKYKEELKETGLKIYEEESGNKDEKWFFAGDVTHWETPLCEIVLNSTTAAWHKDWFPSFQVDIDTTLTMEELEKLSQEYFGNDFWKFTIDIPDYGVVLAIAILGEIDGVKITLGVGTNLRNTEYHRNHLKEV